MATSGSIDYAESTENIIKDALSSIGALEPGETPEHEIFVYSRRQLNRLVKAWMAKGYTLWRATAGEITLVASQQSYTMGGSGSPDFSVRPLRIENMRFVQSNGTESPIMSSMSREDYLSLPEKDSAGTSTQYYYDPQLTQGVLYIWPVLASVNGEKIKFTYQRTFEDFDANADEPDFPQEWYDAIVKNLAAQLAPTLYPGQPGITQQAKALARESLDEALSFDREYTEVCFTLGDEGY